MSREIKFRAWCKEEKRFVDLNGFEIAFKGLPNQGQITEVIEQGRLAMINIGDVELMQYTGLKDESGVEIYEGDLYDVDGYGLGEVIIDHYHGGSFQGLKDYGVVTLSHVIQLDLDYDRKGNIHQNPELLEKTK